MSNVHKIENNDYFVGVLTHLTECIIDLFCFQKYKIKCHMTNLKSAQHAKISIYLLFSSLKVQT